MSENKPTRRQFMQFTAMGMAGAYLDGFQGILRATPTELWIYVGTYTSAGSEGIYLCRLDMATGALQKVGVTRNVVEPSFLATDLQGRYLYAVNEGQNGAVSAFAVNPTTRALTPINQQSSLGGAPCHLSLDATNRYLLVANYSGGNVSVFPIQSGGGLGGAVEVENLLGASQGDSNAHQVTLDAANQYALVADLGMDKVMIYRFNSTQGTLDPAQQASFSTRSGAGPRHFAFHPNGQFVFLINELNSTVTSLAYDPTYGTLRELQTVSALPSGYSGTSYCAEIQVSPDGRFLYGSNRGHNSIVVYSISSTGKLTLVQHISTQGQWPRHFTIDPTGTYLLVANQHTNNIVSFRRNASNGTLTALGKSLTITAPTCLLVAPSAV